MTFTTNDRTTKDGNLASAALRFRNEVAEAKVVRFSYNEAGELTEVVDPSCTVTPDCQNDSVISSSLNGKPVQSICRMVSYLDYVKYDITQSEDGTIFKRTVF